MTGFVTTGLHHLRKITRSCLYASVCLVVKHWITLKSLSVHVYLSIWSLPACPLQYARTQVTWYGCIKHQQVLLSLDQPLVHHTAHSNRSWKMSSTSFNVLRYAWKSTALLLLFQHQLSATKTSFLNKLPPYNYAFHIVKINWKTCMLFVDTIGVYPKKFSFVVVWPQPATRTMQLLACHPCPQMGWGRELKTVWDKTLMG